MTLLVGDQERELGWLVGLACDQELGYRLATL